MNNFFETAYLILVLVSAGTALGWLARLLQRRERVLPAIFLALSAVTLWLLLAPEQWILNLFVQKNWTEASGVLILSLLHRASRRALLTYLVLSLGPLLMLILRTAQSGRSPSPRTTRLRARKASR